MTENKNPKMFDDMLFEQEPVTATPAVPSEIDIPLDPADSRMPDPMAAEEELDVPMFVTRRKSPATAAPEKKKKRRRRTGKDKWRIFSRCFLRVMLVLLITIAMTIGSVLAIGYNIFNGPYPAACEKLTMSLAKSSGTFWIPAFFMGEERFQQIMAGDETLEEPEDVSGKVEDRKSTRLNSSHPE